MVLVWKKCKKGLKVKMKTADEMRQEGFYRELHGTNGEILFMQLQNRQIYWEGINFTEEEGVIVKIDKSQHLLLVNFKGNVLNLRPQILKESK